MSPPSNDSIAGVALSNGDENTCLWPLSDARPLKFDEVKPRFVSASVTRLRDAFS
ncbi:hypothetical protein [Rhodopirellula sp. SWK7]|uniref:hypothetical protein n=1 Tax=Rhodopirellula sp. SWK7 TaxID=595460 RepID=UPI0002BD8FAA|nr:hypothetical protein [Rhodopirellula sp. SWK7]EMI45939.1 hypothetical protein RRSWK_01546 [Rhodopirellula sp. SWK7]